MYESIYDQWADIYDLVYSYVREDIPFYVEEARRAGGPVLELGCGTGRVTMPIASAGLDIVGVEFATHEINGGRGLGHLGFRSCAAPVVGNRMQGVVECKAWLDERGTRLPASAGSITPHRSS